MKVGISKLLPESKKFYEIEDNKSLYISGSEIEISVIKLW